MNSLIMLKIVDWLDQEKRFCCYNFILEVQNDIELLQIFEMFLFFLSRLNLILYHLYLIQVELALCFCCQV